MGSRPWAGFWAVGLLLARSGYRTALLLRVYAARAMLASFHSIVAALLLLLLPIGTRAGDSAHPSRRMDGGEDAANTLLQRSRRRRARAHRALTGPADRAACRASIASELKGAIRHELRSSAATSEMVTLVTQEIAGGVVAFFVEFATVTLPNMFMRNLVDILCDIMIFGLVIAVANAVEGTAARQISLGIAQEVEFSLPPSFTVYMTAAISLRLAKILVGYLARLVTDYIDQESMPKVIEVSTQQITQTLGTTIATSVLGTLPHALTLTLSHSLTHSLNHYYYCGYCFYYGDFCQYCFYYRDYAWLKRMWWRGGGMAATADRDSAAPAPAVTRYFP